MTQTAPELFEAKNQLETINPQINDLEGLKKMIDECENSDQKLRRCIELMEESLSQPKAPHFKNFWEARKVCMELFKDSSLSPILRGQLWSKFVDLTQQARQLKKIFEEQSAFAVEQIGSAIEALENEIAHFEENIHKTPKVFFESKPKTIQNRVNYYADGQRKINLYNALAAKINSLRKELIKTEMRIRNRNQFFQRLSKAGDLVFPARKNIIQEVSSKFSDDIRIFIKKNPLNEDANQSLHFIREEIKALQGFAKEIYLTTPVFTETRGALSQHWDKMRGIEKDRKKKQAEFKQIYQENFEDAKRQIEEFKASHEQGSLTSDQANQRLSSLQKLVLSREHGIHERKTLKEELAKVKDLLFEKIQKEENIRIQQEKEKEQKIRENLLSLKAEIKDFEATAQKQSSNELKEKYQDLKQRTEALFIDDYELEILRARLDSFQDLILERLHSEALKNSKSDAETLDQLQKIHEEKLQLKQEIKARCDKCRKSAGSSGLDFEKAMYYQEQLLKERERLEAIEKSLEEIEEEIEELS